MHFSMHFIFFEQCAHLTHFIFATNVWNNYAMYAVKSLKMDIIIIIMICRAIITIQTNNKLQLLEVMIVPITQIKNNTKEHKCLMQHNYQEQ